MLCAECQRDAASLLRLASGEGLCSLTCAAARAARLARRVEFPVVCDVCCARRPSGVIRPSVLTDLGSWLCDACAAVGAERADLLRELFAYDALDVRDVWTWSGEHRLRFGELLELERAALAGSHTGGSSPYIDG